MRTGLLILHLHFHFIFKHSFCRRTQEYNIKVSIGGSTFDILTYSIIMEAEIDTAPGAQANKGRIYYCIIDKDTFIEISIFININTD